MAIDFTDNPSNGDIVTAGGRTYTYESSSAKWKITSTTALNPTLTATASGTLANGDMVVVNSDGSVSAVTQTAASAGVGSESIFESASTNATAATFDSNANKVVVVYKDIGNSGYGTAVVGTVSGTSIAFGTPVVFNSGEVSYPRAVFNSTTNKIVVSYRAHNITNRPHAIVGTVSGTGITFGTASALDSVSTNFVDCASIPNTSKVIFAISVGTSKGMTVVGTISGTSITIGSEDTFLTGYCVRPVVVWDSNSNKAVIAFRDHNNSGYAKAVVATVSGTDTTFGSLSTFHADSTYSSSIGFDSNLNKVVIAYRDNTTDYGEVVVGTVSGTSITFGTPVVFSTGRPFDMWPTFDSNTNKIVLAYYEANNSYQGQIRVGTVSGTSISFDSAISFGTNKILNIGSVFDSTSNKTIITFENDIDNTEYGTAVVFSTASNTTNLTASNYIGVSDAAYSDSATATIQLMGAVDDAQSGLTPGQSYYIQNDGTLSTSAGTPSVLAGTAISATKLIVKGEIAAAAAAGLLVSSSGGGVTTYANIAALPSSGNTAGDLAFVTDVKAFYGWDGTEWDRIFSGQNMLPEFTTSPAASYNLASDGTATTVTVAATDPEGFAITYSHDTTPANQAQATITQSGGTFTVTPSTTVSNGGTFTARFKAFDGVRTNSASSTFSLSFGPTSISGLIGYWDFGDSSSYGGSGTTWTDISSNSNNITFSGGTYSSSTTAHGVAAMQFAAGGQSVGNFEFPTALTGTGSGKAKTVILIYHTPTSLEDTLLWSYSSSNSTYAFVLQDGVTAALTANFSAHSGESIVHRANGNTALTTRDAAFDAHEQSKYNTAIISGAVFASGVDFNGYLASDYRKAHHVRALIVYDTVLSTTNMQKIHDYYRAILGSSNMPAWSS